MSKRCLAVVLLLSRMGLLPPLMVTAVLSAVTTLVRLRLPSALVMTMPMDSLMASALIWVAGLSRPIHFMRIG